MSDGVVRVQVDLVGLPEVREYSGAVKQLREELARLRSRSYLKQEWYTKREYQALRGVSRTYLDEHPYCYPAESHIVGGLRRFHWTAVAEALPLDDDQLRERWLARRAKSA